MKLLCERGIMKNCFKVTMVGIFFISYCQLSLASAQESRIERQKRASVTIARMMKDADRSGKENLLLAETQKRNAELVLKSTNTSHTEIAPIVHVEKNTIQLGRFRIE